MSWPLTPDPEGETPSGHEGLKYSDRKRITRRGGTLQTLRETYFSPSDQDKADHIIREYKHLQKEVKDVEVDEAALDPVNQGKNRYPDVLPLKGTAVKLQEVNGISGSNYINANFVKDLYSEPGVPRQTYICCQAPLVHTFADFWRMLWEQNVRVIVMITNLIERNRIKADTYWPTRLDQTLRYGIIRVRLVREYQRGHNVIIRQFHIWRVEDEEKSRPSDSTSNPGHVTDEEGEAIAFSYSESGDDTDYEDEVSWDEAEGDFSISSSSSEEELPVEGVHEVRKITQLHCTKWPDFGVPESAEVMKDLIHELDLRKTEVNSPVVVHCSAGIGRTGTFLAIHMALQNDLHGEKIDIRDTVRHLRTQRLGMVQSKEQYMFVYAVVAEMLKEREEFNSLRYRHRHHRQSIARPPKSTSPRSRKQKKAYRLSMDTLGHSTPSMTKGSVAEIASPSLPTLAYKMGPLSSTPPDSSPTFLTQSRNDYLANFVEMQRKLHEERRKSNNPRKLRSVESSPHLGSAVSAPPSPAVGKKEQESESSSELSNSSNTTIPLPLPAHTRKLRTASAPKERSGTLKRSRSDDARYNSRGILITSVDNSQLTTSSYGSSNTRSARSAEPPLPSNSVPPAAFVKSPSPSIRDGK